MKYNKKDYKTWNKSQKSKFLKIAKQHQDADRFIQWKWLQDEKIWKEFRWCFYGCMTQTEDNTLEKATEVMWLPAWIIHVSEKIFEWLPRDEAIKLPLQLLEAIPTWLDTYQLWKDWSYTVLMDKEYWSINYCWDNKECIDAVKQYADLFKTDFTESAESAESAARSTRSARFADSAARSAARSARSAADSTWSSADSAWSAAWSARSAYYYATKENHYIWLKDTLIKMIRWKTTN